MKCFHGAQLITKEAYTLCSEQYKITKENAPYLTVTYNVTDILDVIFQAGYSSCFLTLQLSQSKITSGCNLFLHYRLAHWLKCSPMFREQCRIRGCKDFCFGKKIPKRFDITYRGNLVFRKNYLDFTRKWKKSTKSERYYVTTNYKNYR